MLNLSLAGNASLDHEYMKQVFYSASQIDFSVDKIDNISSYMCESYVFPLYL